MIAESGQKAQESPGIALQVLGDHCSESSWACCGPARPLCLVYVCQDAMLVLRHSPQLTPSTPSPSIPHRGQAPLCCSLTYKATSTCPPGEEGPGSFHLLLDGPPGASPLCQVLGPNMQGGTLWKMAPDHGLLLPLSACWHYLHFLCTPGGPRRCPCPEPWRGGPTVSSLVVVCGVQH